MTDQALQTTETFNGQIHQLAQTETASAAVAEQARAAVESRYIMAMNRPRNWDDVRTRLLKECKRPGFANAALYRKPIGGGVEGFSIRFVETALRCMTNIFPEVLTVYDDNQKKIVRVSVTDLESNLCYSKDVTVTKTVERSKPASDNSYISVRQNSYGKNVYTLPATDDEILNKENALVSKALRTQGLRLIPGDILDEAETIVREVKLDTSAQDPNAERKKLVDAFDSVGVSALALAEYMEQELDSLSPAQLSSLRGIYAAIRDGEATWRDVLDGKEQTDTKPSAKKKARRKPQNSAKKRIESQLKQGGPTFADVAHQIVTAKDIKELAICQDLANSFDDEQRDELLEMIEAREEVIDQGSTAKK